MPQNEQEFLTELEKKLWTSANKLLPALDASQYKHVVLGLVFLKYVSDSFDIRRDQLIEQFNNPEHDYFLDSDGLSPEEHQAEIETELEERDYYAEANVFWVPQQARWEFLQNNNKVVITGEVKLDGKKIRSVGQLIDNALDVVEQDNPKLKGVLNKRYTQLQIDQAKLGELIDLIATVPFTHATLSSKDILGHVYEYFLGQFALAEGKKGGQFYTPKSIVSLIVQMLEPFKGRVYDPAMGSGGFFVQSENFIAEHQGRIGDVSIYGQEFNHTTWQLAAMNMVIRGIDFNFGKQPANTFINDQHPDLRADFVMANPPFNMKEWDVGISDDDPRWQYGKPPTGNANFAWLQHMLWHLSPNGSLGLLLANGSMSSNTSGEGDIRKALIENDLVECMVALPGQLFTNTQIPACIWFLSKNKKVRNSASGKALRDRSGEILFIDARNLGYMKDRVLRDFTHDDLNKVTETFHHWQALEPLTPTLSQREREQLPQQLPSPSGRGAGGEGGSKEETNKKTKIPEKLLKFARELRKNQTDAENLIWQLLRNRQIAEAKFRRQHPIEKYILDFYCHEHKLAIEIDGSQHFTDEAKEKDNKRTAWVEQQGITIIRFDNRQVLVETEAVLESIYHTITSLTPALSHGERELERGSELNEGKKSPLPRGEDLGEGSNNNLYQDIAGFCKSASLADIQKHDYVLTPGRYVGAVAEEDDGEPFADKMARLTGQLKNQFAEGEKLEAEIKKNLSGLGYEL